VKDNKYIFEKESGKMFVKKATKKAFWVLVVFVAIAIFIGCEKKENPAAVSGTDRSAGTELQPVKIAVAFWQIDANALLVQKYLQEYVSPALNVSFMFSEAVADADSLMTFMENAYAAGCQGIMNYQNSSIEQAIAKANELGMYIATNTTIEAENSDALYNTGFVAADPVGVAKSFGDLVRVLVNDGRQHNIIIVSAGAGFGNPEHYEAAKAILHTLEDVYGLKYTKTVEELAVSRAETVVANDKGIKIVIYPGFPTGDTYVTGMSVLLQTGDYDTVLACNAAYARFSVAIDEVEKAYGKDIRVSAITSINDQTRTAFTTLDSSGNSSLNSALVMPSVSTAVGLFSLVYNGITGYADRVRINGSGSLFDSPKWKCGDVAEYSRIERINTSDDKWEVTLDELKQLLVVFNPAADSTSIYRQLEGVTSEYILQARGL
jgi:hypothetical protein